MEMEKKNVAIIVLVIALVASGIGNIFLILPYLTVTAPPNVTFTRATGSGPYVLDPCDTWDQASNEVIDMVCEALFAYNFTDLNMPRYPELAESYHWVSGTELQIKLREGITFHDGAPFNAAAVKWNFDRLNYLCGIVDGPQDRIAPFNDTKPSATKTAEASSLYFLPNGKPIFNKTVVVSEYNVTIYLNGDYAPFLDLLCFQASYMISPISMDDPTIYIQLYERLIGTGPFKFISYTSGVEVRFERNDDYWQTPAYFQYIVYAIIASGTARSNAMLAHEVDWAAGTVSSLLSTFEADPTITVDKFTDRTGIPSLAYYYMGMNNVLLNITWRKAISYALNYTYINTVVYNDQVIRANSPIAPGFGDAYNASVIAPSYDLTLARQTMVSMGFGNMGWTNDQWKAATFKTLNYTYNTDNPNRVLIAPLAIAWLDLIGIEVLDTGVTWAAFLNLLYGTPNQLGIYWVGWGPDYLDPFNMLDPLFNPASSADSAQIDDAYLTGQMTLALQTTDDVARNNIYKHIQWYIVSQYMHCFGMHPKIYAVYDSHIHGVYLNAKQDLYLYPVYRS
jgi:peptide/nickel transport system substrate-binding protein